MVLEAPIKKKRKYQVIDDDDELQLVEDKEKQKTCDTPIYVPPEISEEPIKETPVIYEIYHKLVKEFKTLQMKEQTNRQSLKEAAA